MGLMRIQEVHVRIPAMKIPPENNNNNIIIIIIIIIIINCNWVITRWQWLFYM